jgi:hypothetical protein
MLLSGTWPGREPETRRPGESRHFIDGWMREHLPPFYREFSVVELAQRLRQDASAAGIDLRDVEEARPFAIEQIIILAAKARIGQ